MAKEPVEFNEAEETPAVSEISVSVALDKLKARHQALIDALNRETNIITRYELKIRLEELVSIFNELAALQ